MDRASLVAKGLLLAAALSLVGVWVSDYAWLEYRIGRDTAGQAFGSVTFYDSTTMKNGKVEVFYDQPQTQPCVHAIFPHSGDEPCWFAGRKTVKSID